LLIALSLFCGHICEGKPLQLVEGY
jgi:hypothetical protein